MNKKQLININSVYTCVDCAVFLEGEPKWQFSMTEDTENNRRECKFTIRGNDIKDHLGLFKKLIHLGPMAMLATYSEPTCKNEKAKPIKVSFIWADEHWVESHEYLEMLDPEWPQSTVIARLVDLASKFKRPKAKSKASSAADRRKKRK